MTQEPFHMLAPGQTHPALQEKRYIQVYTGDGKGKTTASLGLILRALGRGWRVLLVMFTKGGHHYGELTALRSLSPPMARRLTVVKAGLDRIVFSHNQNENDSLAVRAGWQIAKQAGMSGDFDLLVMDEANIALDLAMIDLKAMLTFLANKPDSLEVVLTGRRAHPEIIAVADLVSEVKPVKHYWDVGVRAREGIEY